MITTHALHRPIYGHAHLDGGTLTVGTHADDSPARIRLTVRGTVQHTTVFGANGSGISTLLRSVLLAAQAAEVPAAAIDVDGALTGLGTPTADTVRAARLLLAAETDLAHTRLAMPATERGLRLLVINDLDQLTLDRSFSQRLSQLTRVAGRARIVVLAGTRLLRLDAFGGRYLDATPIRHTLTQHLVLLRTADLRQPSLTATGIDGGKLAPIPDRFPDGSPTAGIGYLPRQSAVPFRAWLP